jgi:hypothetical protein
VREFVQHHVAPIFGIRRAVDHVIPREHDLPERPRLARECLAMFLQHAGWLEPQPLDDERAGVDEDAMQAREVVLVAIEKQQARLRRDRDAHLLCDLQAVAAGEFLLAEEDLHVAFELRAQIAGKTQVCGHAMLEDGAPCDGEGLRAQAPATTLPQPRAGRDTDDGQYRGDCDQEQGLHAGFLRVQEPCTWERGWAISTPICRHGAPSPLDPPPGLTAAETVQGWISREI